ncbi:MAG TPA: TonB family protein [Candidatus Acidoferrales bacterium]|nr:TonB family protein [Candidatus Acidoferrales bacterium]
MGRGVVNSGATSASGEASTAPKSANAGVNTTDNADAAIESALCQIVYPLDETPENGYRYMFFGNGFFINDQGYVVTAAHLLEYFRNGGIPYILVGPEQGPRRMVEAPIVAVDWDHDVAVLKPDTNPLQTDKKISYLRISTETPVKGKGVLSASLRPPDTENAHSSLAPLEDFSRSEVLDYLFFRDKGEQSELLLFNQDVVPGQSGSPLVSAETNEVVGIVVGKWLHPTVIPSGADGGHTTIAPGAALRIHYAISLLDELHVSWNSSVNAVPEVAAQATTKETTRAAIQSAAQPAVQLVASASTQEASAQQQGALQQGYVPPSPLSVVGVPYPPQALFGGNVLLDASVDADGKLSDVRVVNGDEPFLAVALDAVRTWSFSPAQMDGRVAAGRIGIVFQFPQSYVPAIVARDRTYVEPLADAAGRGALPVYTIEPTYPINSIAEGSVILYGLVDPQGQLTSTTVIRNIDSLTVPTEQAVAQWKWAPGKDAGAKTVSPVIVVVTYRRPTL